MIELKFGVPSQRARKTEKYPETAVVTMLAYKGKGTSKKFEFNKKALELLKLDEKAAVAVSYAEGNVMFVNATGRDDIEGYKLTKNSPRTISNQKVYDYTKTFLSVDEATDTEFRLELVGQEYNGAPVCFLVNMEDTTQEDEASLAETEVEETREEISALQEEMEIVLGSNEAEENAVNAESFDTAALNGQSIN